MIEGRRKRKNEEYQRSNLYIIENDESIEYIDKSGDSATVQYKIKDGQHGLYADEFRPQQVPKEGAKVIDLSMGIDDYTNKKCIWGLYDLKKTLGGKDVITKLCEQWQAALRYWYNCVLNNMDGYIKEGKIGVVTTRYEKDKVDAYISQLESAIQDADKLKGTLIGAKKNADLPRVKEELKLFLDFKDGRFIYHDSEQREEEWKFDVVISEHHVFVWEL